MRSSTRKLLTAERTLLLAGFVAVLGNTACETQPGPLEPTQTGQRVSPFPDAPAGSAIFNSTLEVDSRYRGASTRFVFVDSVTFTFQFSGGGQYPGRYSREGEVLEMKFDGNASWTAKGILEDDFLQVSYNEWAQWDDFVDGVYIRAADQRGTDHP